jgi:hypothetical protein
MKNLYYLLVGFILLFAGCTKNNQNSPANFAYLNINETFISANGESKFYDIDNDGVVDWGFFFSNWTSGPNTNNALLGFRGDPMIPGFTFFISDTSNSGELKARIIPLGFTINNLSIYDKNVLIVDDDPNEEINILLKGSGDFYIGFKSQNPQQTNTFFGWARLNISADGKTLIVKDMALNTVNGGSINAGQH